MSARQIKSVGISQIAVRGILLRSETVIEEVAVKR